ncbi:MAG TPA: SDR family oxidoreductase [Acidimicrobiia bacterium]|jgi:NAD(P)-dependent dehydrogenase (short-subunit alcohol dehydrogenase family)|nr:SDR family oxidoreductase [Acidimicrobiia bacterium]
MSDRLTGHVCLITGATGMAAAAATRCAAEGAGVFIVSMEPEECRVLAERIRQEGGTAAWSAADLRDEVATNAAVAACVERFGRVDGLFAVAGASARTHGDGPIDQATLDGFAAAYELNAVPAFTVAAAAIRQMLHQDPAAGGRGAIILMSSVLASSPAQLFATHGYATAKGAIEALTVTMAARYAADLIRVNAVAPGLVATPMSQRAQDDPASVAYAARKQPLAQGLLPAEAAADLAVFLLSPESRYITGQVIALDGGWSVTEAPA